MKKIGKKNIISFMKFDKYVFVNTNNSFTTYVHIYKIIYSKKRNTNTTKKLTWENKETIKDGYD